MPDEKEQDALSRIKSYLDAGHSLDAIRKAGWADWLDHFESTGVDFGQGQPPPEDVPKPPESLAQVSNSDAPIGGAPKGFASAAGTRSHRRAQDRLLLVTVVTCFIAAAVLIPVLIARLTTDSYNPLELLPDRGDPLEDLAVETCKDLGIATPSRAGLVIETGYVSASDEGFTADDLYEAVQMQCPESVPLLRLVKVAQDACLELDGAIVLQVGGILNRAISKAEALEFDGPDLGDAMRSDCPSLMTAIEQVGEDQEEREREQERRERLPDLMALAFECGSDNAYGAVRNDSNVTVDVFIDVQFLNGDGVLVDDSIDSINGLRPGETGYWDAPFLSRGRSWATCRAEVNSAFEQ